MNILKKIPFIAIIFFVVVSQVHSNFVKRADGSECLRLGGTCKNPGNCSGTIKSGLCPGGNDNKCCIPKPTGTSTTNKPNTSNNNNNDSRCIARGGTCKNPGSCSGNVISGLCPGGSDNKCCIPKPTGSTNTGNTNTNNSNTNNNKCNLRGGTCKNPKNCSGSIISGLCPGGSDNKCCIPKPTGSTNTGNINTNNSSTNNKCKVRGGTCKNPKNCSGNVISGLCPGGSDNKCCIPKSNSTTNTGNTNSNNTNNSGTDDNRCKLRRGTCMNPKDCKGDVIKGLCPGGSDNRCCIEDSTGTTGTNGTAGTTNGTSNNSNTGNISGNNNTSNGCDISLYNTSLSKDMFVSLLNNYASHTSSKYKSSYITFGNNAEMIYNHSINNGFNPELVVARAISEGFSPGSSHNNYWGIGCNNGAGKKACKSYGSFEEGVLAYINLVKGYGVENAEQMMNIYSYIGDYWFNPGSDSDGGCQYFSNISSYLPSDRLIVAQAACSGATCSKDGHEPECVPTTNEDQSAYAKWQVSKMVNYRNNVFKLSC